MELAMNTHLMMSRRFAPLFWTQFLSAFNDNFLKNTLVFLILFTLAADQAASLVTLAGAIFMAPFLLLSALGGEIADRFDKAFVARRLKFVEIGAALLAVIGIALSSIPVLLTALFLFGVISALFGPIKYGILPDHLERKELPRANAWIESATFAAILGGTIAGGVVSADGIGVAVFGPIMMALAVGCWLVSRYIPATGAAAPNLVIDKNVLRSTWRLVSELRTNQRIWRAALMASWFWLVGAIVLSILPTLVKNSLGGTEIAVTAYLAVFAVAVAIGSAIAAWMSQGRMVLLPAPVGTALMAVFGLDLAWSVWGLQASAQAQTLSAFFSGPNTIRVAIDLAGLAIAGAFLVVPTFAAVQAWAPEDRRARVVAAVNVVSAGFMTLGGGIVAAIQGAGVSIAGVLAGLAVVNAVAAWLMLKYLPTNPFRD
ncbi:MFS transporter, partial [Mesorhizobium sp. M4A.F.Ca.ET.020.02.1.1]